MMFDVGSVGDKREVQMEHRPARKLPNRVRDLVAFRQGGGVVTCNTSFAVVPVDFQHRKNPYQAHVFMCQFEGTVDGEGYRFRKCYAKGCSHNLCPHVSQAVMIANRYLERDYRLLSEAGIALEERLFTLEDMIVKFEGYRDQYDPTFAIEDYVYMAREGNKISMTVEPEYVPGVEHFSNYKTAHIFLTATFTIDVLAGTHRVERCFACYEADREEEEKAPMVRLANERLKELYTEFDRASIRFVEEFFS
jgi:hypothetical protein